MTRFLEFTTRVLVAAAIAASLAGPAGAAPNIVIVVADDLGFGDVGYHGSEIRTPELDRLAAGGVMFERFYVNPVCSPTRATLLTGRFGVNTGVLGPSNPWYARGLPLDEKLLPEYLREAGYRTHAVGKWHLGPNTPEYHPMSRGFDSFYGHLHGYLNYELHTIYGRVDWQRDGRTVHEAGHATQLVTAEAVRHIEERDQDAPLLLYVTYGAPHAPLQASAEAIAEYAHIGDERRRIYAAMVTEMDRGIARITAALEEARIADNTLLVFFSDNGGSLNLGGNNDPAARRQGRSLRGRYSRARLDVLAHGIAGRHRLRRTNDRSGSAAHVACSSRRRSGRPQAHRRSKLLACDRRRCTGSGRPHRAEQIRPGRPPACLFQGRLEIGSHPGWPGRNGGPAIRYPQRSP